MLQSSFSAFSSPGMETSASKRDEAPPALTTAKSIPNMTGVELAVTAPEEDGAQAPPPIMMTVPLRLGASSGRATPATDSEYDYDDDELSDADEIFLDAREPGEVRAPTPAPVPIEQLNDEEKETLYARIVKQTEFYFGDASYPKDKFLLKHARADPEGFISIEVFSRFKKMKKLAYEWPTVADAVKNSDVVLLSKDKTKLKRRHPIPRDPEDALCRTIVIEGIAESTTEEQLRAVCAPLGRIHQIRFVKPTDSLPDDVRLYCVGDEVDHTRTLHPALKDPTGMVALIEYEFRDLANKAIDFFTTDKVWRGKIRVSMLHRKPKAKKEPVRGEDGELKKRRKRRGRGSRRGREGGDETDGASTADEASRTASPIPLDTVPLQRSRTNSLERNAYHSRLSPGGDMRPRCSSLDTAKWKRSPLGGGSRSQRGSPAPGESRSVTNSPMTGRRTPNTSGMPSSRLAHHSDARSSSPTPMRSDSPCWRSPPSQGAAGGSNSNAGSRCASPRPMTPSRDAVARMPHGPDGSRGFGAGRGRPVV
eukprot:m.290797 g.290797  ORF g.290797 m.290797 type:complete len:536 (-) comp12363_c0_seq1:249-1856(-)